MRWNIDEGYSMIDFIPTMITDINLYHKNKVLIIDTKFYANILGKSRYDKKLLVETIGISYLHIYLMRLIKLMK